MQDRKRRAAALGLTAVGALVGTIVLWPSESPSPTALMPSLTPTNRTRRGTIVHDRPYSPPSAAVRRRFDGEWRGRARGTAVVVLLLDGVGDCTLTPDEREAERGEIEITEHFGDDMFDFGAWNRGDGPVLWTAGYDEDADEIRVWRVLPETARLGKCPFVLRRIRAAETE